MLGDNPFNSKDSGRLGLISADQILGRVRKVMKAASEVHAPSSRPRCFDAGAATLGGAGQDGQTNRPIASMR